MVSHHERGEKSSAANSKHPTDSQFEDEKVEAPKVSPIRQKLALTGHYIMLGLVPVISVISLAIGVVAVTGNRSGEEQLSKSLAKIDSLNASMTVSKNELDKLKASLAQEKSIQEEERKKLDEKMEKIIHNITPLQVKLKIFPTLEDQLRQAAMTSAVLPGTASNVVAASAVSSSTEKKPASQVQIMKEAIEKYNKNN